MGRTTVYIGLEADSDSTSAVTEHGDVQQRLASEPASSRRPRWPRRQPLRPAQWLGTTTSLSVLGNDATGQANLYYTWSATSLPSGVTPAHIQRQRHKRPPEHDGHLLPRGNVHAAGNAIANAYGLTVTSSVGVTVNQTVSGITIVPSTAIVNVSATQQFTAYSAGTSSVRRFPAQTRRSPGASHQVRARARFRGTLHGHSTQSTATITATSGSYTATAGVQVFNRDPFAEHGGRFLGHHDQLAEQHDRQRGRRGGRFQHARPHFRAAVTLTAPAPSATCFSATRTTVTAGR